MMLEKRNIKKNFNVEIRKSKLGCVEFAEGEAPDQLKLTILQLLLTFRCRMKYLYFQVCIIYIQICVTL